MRKFALSLAAATTLAVGVQASELSEALTSGKVSADASIYYESRNQDQEISTYYSDTAYAVGTVGLAYTTGTYNNISAKVGFRGFKALWEDDEDFVTGGGVGDASERISEKDEKHAVLSDFYLMYKNDTLTAKLGRQPLSTEFMGKRHDAFTLYANLTKEMVLELIYSQGQVKANYHEYQPLTDKAETVFGGSGGLYKVGLSYKFNDMLSGKIYAFEAPDAYSMYGAKANFKSNGEIPFGAFAQYTQQDLDSNNNDYDFTKLQLSSKFAGVGVSLGYLMSSEDGFPQTKYNVTGNPFEEGDQVFAADAKTPYIKLDYAFDKAKVIALYGVTDYKKSGVSYDKDELNIIASYKISNDLMAKLWYTATNEDEADAGTTDLQQVSALLQYKF